LGRRAWPRGGCRGPRPFVAHAGFLARTAVAQKAKARRSGFRALGFGVAASPHRRARRHVPLRHVARCGEFGDERRVVDGDGLRRVRRWAVRLRRLPTSVRVPGRVVRLRPMTLTLPALTAPRPDRLRPPRAPCAASEGRLRSLVEPRPDWRSESRPRRTPWRKRQNRSGAVTTALGSRQLNFRIAAPKYEHIGPSETCQRCESPRSMALSTGCIATTAGACTGSHRTIPSE